MFYLLPTNDAHLDLLDIQGGLTADPMDTEGRRRRLITLVTRIPLSLLPVDLLNRAASTSTPLLQWSESGRRHLPVTFISAISTT